MRRDLVGPAVVLVVEAVRNVPLPTLLIVKCTFERWGKRNLVRWLGTEPRWVISLVAD